MNIDIYTESAFVHFVHWINQCVGIVIVVHCSSSDMYNGNINQNWWLRDVSSVVFNKLLSDILPGHKLFEFSHAHTVALHKCVPQHYNCPREWTLSTHAVGGGDAVEFIAMAIAIIIMSMPQISPIKCVRWHVESVIDFRPLFSVLFRCESVSGALHAFEINYSIRKFTGEHTFYNLNAGDAIHWAQ